MPQSPNRSLRPSSLLKKVFEVSRWATLIQDPSARRTKDSQPSGFGFEYCASHVRFRVFQQTARADCCEPVMVPPPRVPTRCEELSAFTDEFAKVRLRDGHGENPCRCPDDFDW